MEENPFLVAYLPLNQKFAHLSKIIITDEDFKVGRGLSNTLCIPHLSISRKHCTFKKTGDNEWYIEDHSSAGIKINDVMLGKDSRRKLEHEDVIALEPSEELCYKFVLPALDAFEIPRKRRKMDDTCDSTILDSVKLKFEQSQKCEIQHIENKIQNAKQMQTTTMTLKKKLQEDMDRKIQQLEKDFSVQIENLKGEKNEVEMQKATLIEERDAQLAKVKDEMEKKISDLMERISKQNETELELLRENNLLKEKLEKEREDFLSELNRESSSKQDMLEKLEAKIREQEEARLKEKQELEEMAELKQQREKELEQELVNIKQNLGKQIEQTEQLRIKAEKELQQQMEQMNKLKAEEKAKMDQLQKEREVILKKLSEAENDAEKAKIDVLARVLERETELAALAAERIQIQVDQSSEVISTLQQQLEKVTSQLQTVETEKNTLLENICTDGPREGTSKTATLNEFGEIMESELQCSICAELFVEATTLNCSHTFCKYCITMWKKKKRDCPICRSPITSECKSLVLDTFIEKMVQSLTDEMKKKREEMLKYRAEEVQNSSKLATANSRKRRNTTRRATTTTITVPSGRGTDARTRQIPTVDLTTLPTPMSPAVRPPTLLTLPAQLTMWHSPPQASGQIQTENQTTSPRRQADLPIATVSRIPTFTTEVRRMTTDTVRPQISNQTRPMQLRSHRQNRQRTGNLTHHVHILDLTSPPISRIPIDERQMPTETTVTGQIMADPTQMTTVIDQPAIDPTHPLQVTTDTTVMRQAAIVPTQMMTDTTVIDQLAIDPTHPRQVTTDTTVVRQATIERTQMTTVIDQTAIDPTHLLQMTTDTTVVRHAAIDPTQITTDTTVIDQLAMDLTHPRQVTTDATVVRHAAIDPTQMTTDMTVIDQLAMDLTHLRQMATDMTVVRHAAIDPTQMTTDTRVINQLAMNLTHPRPMMTDTTVVRHAAIDPTQMTTDTTVKDQLAMDLTHPRQVTTDTTVVRQAAIDPVHDHQMTTDTTAMRQAAIDPMCPRQMTIDATVVRQTATDLTRIHQISTVDGQMLPTPRNPTDMLATMQDPQIETGSLTLHQVQTVDPSRPANNLITTEFQRMMDGQNVIIPMERPAHRQITGVHQRQILMIPMSPGERPPLGAPIRLLRLPPQQGLGGPVIVTLEDDDVGTSQASRAPTTAATGAASNAAPAATGRPAAPSDNQSQGL